MLVDNYDALNDRVDRIGNPIEAAVEPLPEQPCSDSQPDECNQRIKGDKKQGGNRKPFLKDREAFTAWAKAHGMAIQYIQPGKPNQNAFIERFNRTYREDVLDRYLAPHLDDVREATWRFLIDYNEHREHDALNGVTPIEYRNQPVRCSTSEMSA